MSNFNFTGAQAAEEKDTNIKRTVEPGYQNLTIVKVEEHIAGTGAKGVSIEFQSDQPNTYTFNQRFYLNNADGSLNGGMPSFLYLVEAFTGASLPENINNIQGISALLVGKTVDATVGGERYTVKKDGNTYNNIRPQLPFGSWKGDRGTPYIRGEWDTATDNSMSEASLEASPKTDDLPF